MVAFSVNPPRHLISTKYHEIKFALRDSLIFLQRSNLNPLRKKARCPTDNSLFARGTCGFRIAADHVNCVSPSAGTCQRRPEMFGEKYVLLNCIEEYSLDLSIALFDCFIFNYFKTLEMISDNLQSSQAFGELSALQGGSPGMPPSSHHSVPSLDVQFRTSLKIRTEDAPPLLNIPWPPEALDPQIAEGPSSRYTSTIDPTNA